MIKDQPLTQEQSNEFQLNHLGYYCKVRSVWNRARNKSDYSFDIIQYDNDKEVLIQQGKKLFACNEIEAINERDKIISYYLKKVKNEMPK